MGYIVMWQFRDFGLGMGWRLGTGFRQKWFRARNITIVPVNGTNTVGITANTIPDSHRSYTGTFVLNLLQCRPPCVRCCFGCSQSLKPACSIAKPAYDLTIITLMNRAYRATPGGDLMFKEANVYFHVHSACIKMKQPYFKKRQTKK